MKLTMLGTGTPAPDPDRNASGLLLVSDGTTVLIDAGRGVAMQLIRAGVQARDLQHVCVSHLHFDHVSDLADIILSGWCMGRPRPLEIYGPVGTGEMIDALLSIVYSRDIAFRYDWEKPINRKVVAPKKMVNVHEFSASADFAIGEIEVNVECVEHGHGLIPALCEWVCLGFRFTGSDGSSLTFSGDCVPCSGLSRLAREVDVLIQCCYQCSIEIENGGESARRSSRYVLASSLDAGKIATRAGARNLVLTHFLRKSDNLMDTVLQDVRADFDGPIYLARDMTTIDIDHGGVVVSDARGPALATSTNR